jgi:hypothetical protein
MSTTGTSKYEPSMQELLDAFADEITSLGGTVANADVHEHLMIARAVLAIDADVRLGDKIRGGVAMRASGPLIEVHPYTFREVCANGAIIAQSLESRRLVRPGPVEVSYPAVEVMATLNELRDTVRACASQEAFTRSIDGMRAAAEIEANAALEILAQLTDLPRVMAHMLRRILDRFTSAADKTAFGLMNAVTSVARDTRDPQTRWTLETLGGGVPAWLLARARSAPMESLVGA